MIMRQAPFIPPANIETEAASPAPAGVEPADWITDEDVREAARIRRERERRKAAEDEALVILNEALGRIVELGCDIIIETHAVGGTAQHSIRIQAQE